MGWDRFPRGLRGTLGVLCALAGAVSASAEPKQAAQIAEIPHTQPPASEAERLLVVHNAERTRLGLPPLVWNPALARDAGDYAKVLLDQRRLQHASAEDRKGSGENLWMGTAGAWNSDAMVEMFLEERRYFRAATFPDVSLTGNWSDVGHYTQIVWRETKEVGCAIDTGKGMDVLVCRYHPAGNVVGKNPF
jgi:hypothetical protein